MRQPAARLKGIKTSTWALQDPATQQLIAFADENREPRLAPLHLATLCQDPAKLPAFKQLASRRLAGVPYELVRVDRL